MTWRERIFGTARNVNDPEVFHKISLVAFLAWIGLGADGLSSSAYGPEEAFRYLAGHEYMALFLAMAMAFTIFLISYAYCGIIEQFPHGGGGYLVASKLLSPKAGLVAGCALLVDYGLTISISVASGANAIFSLLPESYQQFKFMAEVFIVCSLVMMNWRGVKESVKILMPIFLVFLITHVILILGIFVEYRGEMASLLPQSAGAMRTDISNLGLGALLLIFLRAYSMGGGTYTGIEAVSNGLSIMREPRVATGKRTMAYLALSLALVAGGLLLAYLLTGIEPHSQLNVRPMNAILVEEFVRKIGFADLGIGQIFIILTLLSEGALLFVAAQTGFIDGPRVMANMALDSWFPHQFASLSESLTMRNGVNLMGAAALGTLFFTRGNVHYLVVMYSINVFLTFSLSNLGMSRFWLGMRKKSKEWISRLSVHGLALLLCLSVLCITIFEKFREGGWVTLVITGGTVLFCHVVKTHYRNVAKRVQKLDQSLVGSFVSVTENRNRPYLPLDPAKPTAALLVAGFGGLGIHTLLQIQKVFPGHFKQVVFLSIGVLDSGVFKGVAEIESLRANTVRQLEKYVQMAQVELAWASKYEMSVGADVVEELEKLCRKVFEDFPQTVFFSGKLMFPEPTWWHKIFHNETAFAVQRRIGFDGLPMVVLPIRIMK